MKGICHTWSRGRHFSPSLPGDRYLNLGSKSDHRAEISGNIVWYDALAPRPEVLRSFSPFYANSMFLVLFFLQVQHFCNYILFEPFETLKTNCSLNVIFTYIWCFVFVCFCFFVLFSWSPFSGEKMVLNICSVSRLLKGTDRDSTFSLCFLALKLSPKIGRF